MNPRFVTLQQDLSRALDKTAKALLSASTESILMNLVRMRELQRQMDERIEEIRRLL